MNPSNAPNQIPPQILLILNQLCDLEQKIETIHGAGGLKRNVRRMREAFAELHFEYENPLGQPFNETRTDVEAHISGTTTENLRIVEVMKPIVRVSHAGTSRIVQRGVVIVSAHKE